MDLLRKETIANAAAFSKELSEKITFVQSQLCSNENVFTPSYLILTSLQAWKNCLLGEMFSSNESFGFFEEAQNDALTSHALATLGIWRGAHQSLRSLLENIAYFLYYKDHPVEYEQWTQGKHWIQFKDLREYFSSHPRFLSIPSDIRDFLTGVSSLKAHYASLSQYVHGSLSTRMTGPNDFPKILSFEQKYVGKWSSQEKTTVELINKLLVCFFRDSISGTNLPRLRKSISLVLGDKEYQDKLYDTFQIRLFE